MIDLGPKKEIIKAYISELKFLENKLNEMVQIPVNTTMDNALEEAAQYIINTLKNNNRAQVTRSKINKEQAYKLCDMFKEKGYYHEIRMHSNDHGAVFFYCVNISKTPIHSDSARLAWSEYVG